ncbi:polyphenol oxidase family protein [Propionicimonas sp.]|uniref:polyphenol oxidase family protein n=1 Tax=Propionicimonas sp. TaxID=1955623 RepID=UPI0017BBC633|nr:polyphenol oxidase family protein [Propionicimonas sp.]MBU3977638.1 polyphenol oxidase family protein [Actinomycetota bacterium]MBA3021562.1 polyphenol oxidase family protein [Propionicimonas sp.]MBU3987112.1 polyphenol oxidase family protein [Actinomycetota bacterium]MBU4008933.1 polyphenol oxidase family protein [Actinomycetota bacterium]MBU4065917.1 polyphenol oxidase family protein [Actinomycetota bacterium]
MYSFTNDPGADGVGIAFFNAVAPSGGRLDLTLRSASSWRGADWDLVEAELGLPVLNAYEVHGDRTLVVSSASDARAVAVEHADGLVTSSRRLGLAVRVADCLPVLLADSQAGVIGAAHAGRVGLAGGVLVSVIEQMRRLGAGAISAWIGPHICGACYEVPAELREDYCQQMPAAAAWTSWGTPSLDLGRAAAEQLAGLDCVVSRVDPCTRTTPTLHSHRRDGTAAGRQAGVVWLP